MDVQTAPQDSPGRVELRDLERLAFQRVPDAIFVTGTDGRIVHANELAHVLSGYSSDELLALTVEDLVPAASRGFHQGHRAAYNESPWERPMLHLKDLTLQTRDGSLVPVAIELSPIDVDGASFVIASVRDDGPIRELRRRLERREALFRDLFQDGPVPYLLVGALDGLVQRCNRQAAELTGVAAAELVGAELVGLFSADPEGRARAEEVLERVRTGSSVVGAEAQLVSGIRGIRWVQMYVSPVRNGMGDVELYRFAMMDVTEQRELQARMERNVRQLTETLSHVQRLEGLLGVCAWCKKVRSDEDDWVTVETYIERHSDREVTHGICPSCQERLDG